MKPPPQEPTCDCCGAPIPALRWDGTYKPVIEGMWCAWCRQPIPSSRQHWAPEDYCAIMKASLGLYHFVGHYGVTTMYGARVGP